MESFYRGNILSQNQKQISACFYKKILLLLQKHNKPSVFVPIRSMQYLSVIEKEEIIFIYSHNRGEIEFSWRNFSPDSSNLNEPIKFIEEAYKRIPIETDQRIQIEFEQSIDHLLCKIPNKPNARKIVNINKSGN